MTSENRIEYSQQLQQARQELGSKLLGLLIDLKKDNEFAKAPALDTPEIVLTRKQLWEAEEAALSADPDEQHYKSWNELVALRENASGESRMDTGALVQFMDARDQLERILARSNFAESLQEYATTSGPLTIEQVQSSTRSSGVFQDVVFRYGWPSDKDRAIDETRKYTDQEFLENLFVNLPSDAKTSGHELGNFIGRLQAEPIDQDAVASSIKDEIGKMPALHRADALHPEFFGAVRGAARAFRSTDFEESARVLARPENRIVVSSFNGAYRILGRLLRIDDASVPIKDAHQELTR